MEKSYKPFHKKSFKFSKKCFALLIIVSLVLLFVGLRRSSLLPLNSASKSTENLSPDPSCPDSVSPDPSSPAQTSPDPTSFPTSDLSSKNTSNIIDTNPLIQKMKTTPIPSVKSSIEDYNQIANPQLAVAKNDIYEMKEAPKTAEKNNFEELGAAFNAESIPIIQLNKALMKCAQNGDLDEFARLLEFYRCTGEIIRKSALSALKNGHLSILKHLIDAGFKFNNNAMFLVAVICGKLNILEYFVYSKLIKNIPIETVELPEDLERNRILLESRENSQMLLNSSLIFSVHNRHLDVFKFLLKMGADIHYKNDSVVQYCGLLEYSEFVKFIQNTYPEIDANKYFLFKIRHWY